MSDWFLMAPGAIWPIALTLAGIYLTLIILTRLGGVRSFSKMSGFDFAVTVATGSVFASIIMAKDPPLFQGIIVLTFLFTAQIGFAILRGRLAWIEALADNKPRLIMIGEDIQYDQLRKAKMTESDLYAKLREANVIATSEIKAVIAETTGDVSVLHGDKDTDISREILEGVIGAERMMSKHY